MREPRTLGLTANLKCRSLVVEAQRVGDEFKQARTLHQEGKRRRYPAEMKAGPFVISGT
jgi:hypothetical protein